MLHLTPIEPARSQFLDTRTNRTKTVSVAAFAIRSGAALGVAYDRANHLRELCKRYKPEIRSIIELVIPSTDRRPTHFLLIECDETPLTKGVFCLLGVDVAGLCDRLARQIAEDGGRFVRMPAVKRKMVCCLMVAGLWLTLASASLAAKKTRTNAQNQPDRTEG